MERSSISNALGVMGGGCHAGKRPSPACQQWVFGPIRCLTPSCPRRAGVRARDRGAGADRPRHGHRHSALREGRHSRRGEAAVRRRPRRRPSCACGRGPPPYPGARRGPRCGGTFPGDVPSPGRGRVGAAVPTRVRHACRGLRHGHAASSFVGDARPVRGRRAGGAARPGVGAAAGTRRWPPGHRRAAPRTVAPGRGWWAAAGDRVLGAVRHRCRIGPSGRAHPGARRSPRHPGVPC